MNTEYKIQSRLMGRQVNATGGYGYLPLMQHFVCKDGFKVSIQASQFHYCTPRTNYGPWYEVEMGFPSEPMPELAEYCEAYDEDKFTATQTVWGRVPIDKVAKILDDHGGIVPEGNE